MKFPPSVLEEIKARLPVSAVVGKRVRLAKAGREWKGLSPFNAEKTPSFFVNDRRARSSISPPAKTVTSSSS